MTEVTEVINESDSEVVLKESNAGVYFFLSTLEARGGFFRIKVDFNATYREYWLGASDVSFSHVISSDDCVEHERIIIRNGRVDSEKLEIVCIKRGMSVTEVVNLTGRCFKVKRGTVELGVLKEEGEYFIQQNPKDKSNLQYSLVEEQNSPIQISFQDLLENQRLKISETGAGIVPIKVPRSWYLTEVCNKTSTEFKVKRRKSGGVSNPDVELATLREVKKFTIEYDPAAKSLEYWLESSTQVLPINSEDFVKFQRLNIIFDSSSRESFKLQSVPRPAPASANTTAFSRFLERLGF